MTAQETILTALAGVIGGNPNARFEWPELVLLAWRADPIRFGMVGHRQHPDTKAVSSCVSYMVKSGLLDERRSETNELPRKQATYALTKKGLNRARKLLRKAA